MSTIHAKRQFLYAFIFLAGVLPGIVLSQVALEVQTGLSLGQTSSGSSSVPVLLGEDSFVILSPDYVENSSEPFCNLLVMRGLHGVPILDGIPFETSAQNANDVWVNPLGLSSSSILVPGPGPDGNYGNTDDILSIVRGLDQPSAATQNDYALGIRGPRRASEIVVLSESAIAWVDFGFDGLANTGNESVRVVYNLQGVPFAELIPLTYGASGRLVAMETGYIAAVLSGPDGVFDSGDDVVAVLRFADNGSPIDVQNRKFQKKSNTPLLGVSWPVHVGNNHLVFPNEGPDGRFGSEDDNLIFLDTSNDSAPLPARVGSHFLWSSFSGPANVDVDEQGRLVMTAGGSDRVRGTDQDEVLVISSPLLGNYNIEVVPLGIAIDVQSFFVPTKSVTLSSGITLVPFRDSSVTGIISAGVVIVKPLPNGQFTTIRHDMAERVLNIEALGAHSAAVFTESGTVVHLQRLQDDDYGNEYLTSVVAGDPKAVTVLSKSVMISTVGSPTVNGFYDDRFQLWRFRATLPYGKGTENAQGYEMRLRGDGSIPKIDGPLFWITLESAPPSTFGYLLVSTTRGSFKPAVDAEILLDIEAMLTPFAWLTDADGNATVPIIPPGVPELAGLAYNIQFLVHNPLNSRRYELSNGLTIAF